MVKSVNIGVRLPVYKQGSGDFRCESVHSEKIIEVLEDIDYGDLKDQLAATLLHYGHQCDYKVGKLFFAANNRSTAMTEVKGKKELEVALSKGKGQSKVVYMSVGAKPEEFDESDEIGVVGSQESNRAFKGLREPPVYVEKKALSGKAAAKLNADDALSIRHFVDALFHDEDSPFFHGFTLYHASIIADTIKMRQAKKEDTYMTDTKNGQYPEESVWHKLAPDGNWNSELHKVKTLGVKLSRGKFGATSNNTIPTAAACKLQLDSAKPTQAPNPQAAAQTTTSAGSASRDSAFASMAALANSTKDLLESKLQAPTGGDAGAGATTAPPQDSKLLKLKRRLSECLATRKEYLDAGYAPDHEAVTDIEADVTRFRKKVREEQALEDEKLFE